MSFNQKKEQLTTENEVIIYFNFLVSVPYLDEIDTLSRDIKLSKNEIFSLQNSTIKNMFYSGIKIPSLWTRKQDYRNVICKVINGDEKFFNFVSTHEMEKKPQEKEIKSNKYLTNEHDLKCENDRPSTNSYYTRSPSAAKTLIGGNTRSRSAAKTLIGGKNTTSRPVTSNTFISKNLALANTALKSRDITSEASKTNGFPMLDDKVKRKINTASVGANREKYKLDQVESGKMSKTTNNLMNVNSIGGVRKMIHKKQNSEGAIFLNTVQMKQVQVENKQIKKLLSECENRGPYYSHCFSCNNRNLEYITKIKVDDATKILTFIKNDHEKEKLRLFKIN